MVRYPNGFNTRPIATALPSNQRAFPQQPTGGYPPCPAPPPPPMVTNHHHCCPGNCFCPTEPAPATAFDSQSVQVHFWLSCRRGWEVGTQRGEGGLAGMCMYGCEATGYISHLLQQTQISSWNIEGGISGEKKVNWNFEDQQQSVAVFLLPIRSRCIFMHSHSHTYTHSHTQAWRMKCSCQLGVVYTHRDLAKWRSAFPLGARGWICIWIQLWVPRFMPLWVMPSSAFFPGFLSLPHSLSHLPSVCVALLIDPLFSSHLSHTETLLFILFARAGHTFDPLPTNVLGHYSGNTSVNVFILLYNKECPHGIIMHSYCLIRESFNLCNCVTVQ